MIFSLNSPVKLIDFGCAISLRTAKVKEKSAGTIEYSVKRAGTIEYFSPEVKYYYQYSYAL